MGVDYRRGRVLHTALDWMIALCYFCFIKFHSTCKMQYLLILSFFILMVLWRHHSLIKIILSEGNTEEEEISQFFLPNESLSWDPSISFSGSCSKVLDSRPFPPPFQTSTISVIIPKVTLGYEASYGNAWTCGRGLRLHAFWGVNHSSLPWYNLHREVVLNRDPDIVGRLSPTGAPLEMLDPYSLEAANAISGYTFPPPQDSGPVYFDIDTDTDGALNHWLFESAVFLEYWIDLKKMHPHIKLLLRQPKGYKVSVATQFFDISEESIVYKNLSPELSGHSNVLTYFPPLLSINDGSTPDVPFAEALWTNFIRHLRFVAGVELPSPWLPNRVLLLPRGKKENYVFNNRLEPLIERLSSFAEKEPQLPCGAILETYSYDSFVDMRLQVQLQAEAKVYIVAYGSAHFFNIALSRNATIIVSNKLHWTHHQESPYLILEQKFGERYNRIIWLGGDESESYIYNLLNDEFNSKGPLA